MTLGDTHQGFIIVGVISALLSLSIPAIFSAAIASAVTATTGGGYSESGTTAVIPEVITAGYSVLFFQLTCEQGQIYNYSRVLSNLYQSTSAAAYLPGFIPKLTMDSDRYDSIVKNTPAIFPISDNPNAASSPPFYQLGLMSAVSKYDDHIQAAAASYGVDVDLVRSIMYLETTHGYYDKVLEPFDKNTSILPMNVQTPRWDSLGTSRAALKNPESNIDIGVKLISRIEARILDATPAKVGTLYNSLSQERVSDYGGRLSYYYSAKPWLP